VKFLNYHHLRYFSVVAKEGGLRKAAEKLHISQPTISAQIAALEGMLNEKLFQRGGRALVLTETGHRVLSYAEDFRWDRNSSTPPGNDQARVRCASTSASPTRCPSL
jgi:molybdenum-dependent DNA-binding transcriptional regulator ModE